MTSLHRHLTDFDRKRHDHTEILTRIDVSQILTVLENCSKHSNDSSLRVSHFSGRVVFDTLEATCILYMYLS